ncbi:MAG TPA: TetR/AcrR family transcriptional regulator [Candidatus Saccharimonadales bacterium]|nr:TetR/AcrR family transcriptional regulator [Candidatus Saccharimonadales bacterium]
MARPRSISTQDILAEAYELLMEVGPSKFTFESLGAKVGLVPTALIRRFKNKKQLILETDRYALTLTDKEVARAISETHSPVEAIIVQFVTELKFASTIQRFTNGQEVLLQDFRDKELYNNYQVSFERRHLQIKELLEKAQQSDLLAPITNVDELARHLEMILHGAGHVWAMTQENTIEEYIRQHVQLALRPYTTYKTD